MIVVLPSHHEMHIDDADMAALEGLRLLADQREHTVYVRARRPGQSGGGLYVHNLIMGGRADHRDGNGLDNRRANLRLCSQAENGLNRAPKRGKKFKGVYPSRGKFYAELYMAGERYASHGHLTEEAAARAYDGLARQYHGEFARLNFPALP